MYLYRDILDSAAAALATASEIPKIELAPNLDLFGVPSKSIIFLSISAWLNTDIPKTASDNILLTFFTALETPLPIKDEPPSRSSTASCSPVDAPEGTAALPKYPFSVVTSTSTVGLPRESKICLACIFVITLIYKF